MRISQLASVEAEIAEISFMGLAPLSTPLKFVQAPDSNISYRHPSYADDTPNTGTFALESSAFANLPYLAVEHRCYELLDALSDFPSSAKRDHIGDQILKGLHGMSRQKRLHWLDQSANLEGQLVVHTGGLIFKNKNLDFCG